MGSNFYSRCKIQLYSVVSNITIEPVFFMLSLCFGSFIIVSKELYVTKVCNVNFNFSREVCDHIQQHKDVQVQVQEHVASLQAYNKVIQAIPGCIYALLAGPWSDRNGRKPLMLCAIWGFVLSNGVFLINTYFFYELKAEWLLFECLQDLTGGSAVFFLASYSYISDVSEEKSRTKRFAYLDGLFPLGFYTANALAGPIKTNLGIMYNFAFGMLCAIICFAYCLIFVKESRVKNEKNETKEGEKMLEKENVDKDVGKYEDKNGNHSVNSNTKNKGSFGYGLFQVQNLIDGFAAVVKKRKYHKRSFIILLIIAFEMEMFALHGKWDCMYLYFKRVLDWTMSEYGQYVSILGFLGLIAQYILVPLLSATLKLHDSTIALLDSLTSVVNYLIIAFAANGSLLYVGGVIAILDSTSTTMYRSMISKNVNSDEVGKVFSIVGTFQALLPFISGPTFNFLYKSTVEDFPQAWVFLVLAIRVFNFFVLLIVNIGMKKQQKRKEKHESIKYRNDKTANTTNCP